MNRDHFVEYCRDFYDAGRPDALYPFATLKEIRDAVEIYARIVPNHTGDSTDRERVRDLVYWAREGARQRAEGHE